MITWMAGLTGLLVGALSVWIWMRRASPTPLSVSSDEAPGSDAAHRFREERDGALAELEGLRGELAGLRAQSAADCDAARSDVEQALTSLMNSNAQVRHNALGTMYCSVSVCSWSSLTVACTRTSQRRVEVGFFTSSKRRRSVS